VDSIPSSAGREDHVSMGSVSARKLGQVIANVRMSLAIEILTASAGLDQRHPLEPGVGVRAAHGAVRAVVPPMTHERPLYRDIAEVVRLLESGVILNAVEGALGSVL
jgi:histidine ammonia-lyase